MDPLHEQRIREAYEHSRFDATSLFQALLAAARETGLDEALGFLEGCVIARRLAWWERVGKDLPRSGEPLADGYQIFYGRYLGLTAPNDGVIVSTTPNKMVTRWWNPCPTLEACQKLGLDTRQVCRKVYQRPVQALLQQIDPRLRFDRNYPVLRPYGAYCEEILSIEG